MNAISKRFIEVVRTNSRMYIRMLGMHALGGACDISSLTMYNT